MTATNKFGPTVGMAMIRDAVLELSRTWLPDYLADAAAAHGKARDWIAAPRTFEVADDVFEWPEAQMPAFLPGIPGTTGTPMQRADRTFTEDWQVTLGAVVAGVTADDTEDQASIYGAAMKQMFLQQGTQLAGLDVESVMLAAGESYPPLPQTDARYVLAPSVPFTVRIAQVASSKRSVLEPVSPPLGDPGPYPTADTVATTIAPKT